MSRIMDTPQTGAQRLGPTNEDRRAPRESQQEARPLSWTSARTGVRWDGCQLGWTSTGTDVHWVPSVTYLGPVCLES